jgi:hypothetical protein
MTEWAPLLAAIWLFWLVDGLRLPRRARWSFTGRTRAVFGRWHWPSPWPSGWRAWADDVPLTLSPSGLANRPVGAAGRPAEAPHTATAWRWEDVREVKAADGWLQVNGARFCADTGHVTAAELRALAALGPAARPARIEAVFRRWFPVLRLRRRARVLRGRTADIAAGNAGVLALLVLATAYLAGDLPARIGDRWANAVASTLPLWFAYAALLHAGAVFLLWRFWRKRPDARGPGGWSALTTAVLFPPQALRLRMLAGEGWTPAVHPLAGAVAWCVPEVVRTLAFNVAADLRWPVGEGRDDALAREVAAWHRARLEREVAHVLREADLDIDDLLHAPAADSAASCRYCPRCGDQFVAGPTHCPHGVPLRPTSPNK